MSTPAGSNAHTLTSFSRCLGRVPGSSLADLDFSALPVEDRPNLVVGGILGPRVKGVIDLLGVAGRVDDHCTTLCVPRGH